MENKLSSIVYEWLSHYDIRASRSYIHSRLASHHAYPSFLSVTDLLDEWGIENAALIIDKEKLKDLPTPFLIDTSNKDSSYLLVKDFRKDFPVSAEFINSWDWRVLVMEKPVLFHDAENERWLGVERSSKRSRLLSVITILAILSAGLLFQFSWVMAILLLLSITGFSISLLTVLEELGIENTITNQICDTGKNFNCSAVLKSKYANLFGKLSLADLSLTWFLSWTIALSIGLFLDMTGPVTKLLSLISIIGIPFSLGSLYYQRWVIRSWCPLCLITIALIWLQAGITIPIGWNQPFSPQFINHLLFALLIFFVVLISWTGFIKPVYLKTQELLDINLRLTRFKNNPAVFEWALKRKVAINATPWLDDLQIGNQFSPVQIMVACNPYCAPCAVVHKILHDIVIHRDIGLTIRFSLTNTDTNDSIVQSASYIIQALKEKSITYKRNALEKWYSHMNLEMFTKQYPLDAGPETSNILSRYVKWSEETKIRYTPTIFINGRQLPGMYKPSDLPYLISHLLNSSGNSSRENESSKKLQLI